MTPGSPRDTIIRWLRARSDGDFAALARLTAPGARWESPVAGTAVGRERVVRNVREGFEDTEQFVSEVLALECRGDKGIAVIHNTGVRDEQTLDSLQTLFIRVSCGMVADVRVAVDDEEAVESFWSD